MFGKPVPHWTRKEGNQRMEYLSVLYKYWQQIQFEINIKFSWQNYEIQILNSWLPGGKLRGRCDALMIKNTKTVSETASNNILAPIWRQTHDICQHIRRFIYAWRIYSAVHMAICRWRWAEAYRGGCNGCNVLLGAKSSSTGVTMTRLSFSVLRSEDPIKIDTRENII